MVGEVFLLIDALSLIHRAFHAYPPLKDSQGQPRGAFYGVSRIFLSLIPSLQPTYLIVSFDTQAPTFRHQEYKEYKAKRPKADPEMIAQIPLVKELFKIVGGCLLAKDGFEADDLIGSSLHFLLKKYPQARFIILSGDYDLAQLIKDDQVVLNYTRGSVKNARQINESIFLQEWGFEPRFLVDYKALAGDQSDNIPGAKGIGKKTALKLVSHFKTIEKIYHYLETDPEKITQLVSARVVQLLEASRDQVFFSKKLAEINKDIQLEELKTLKPLQFNETQLIKFFNRYNFPSLVKMLQKDNQKEKKEEIENKKLTQLSFF